MLPIWDTHLVSDGLSGENVFEATKEKDRHGENCGDDGLLRDATPTSSSSKPS